MVTTMDAQDVVVIKIGTGVLTREDGTLDGASLARLVTAIADLSGEGRRCILVSSGAVGAGTSVLGLSEYPEDVPTRQAAAAVGQTRLMHAYQNLFSHFEIDVAQLLLTGDDFPSAEHRGRIKDTLQRLLQQPGIVPVINENDSVAVEELRVGDNDLLSARVAILVGARLLVLLTSVDGLLPPGSEDIIEVVEEVGEVLGYARGDAKGRFSMGGMGGKLQAVQMAVEAGVETVIANGRRPERLQAIVEGGGYATRFPPRVGGERIAPELIMTDEEIHETVYGMGRAARQAAYGLAQLDSEAKNAILRAMAGELRRRSSVVLEENAKDLAAGEERGLSAAMLDRLHLDEARLEAIAAGIEKVASLADPVGEVLADWTRPNGIRIEQVRVPIGVIGIIYESRPNVTSDAAVLCLKSGNATILRGGSEAIHSNRAIAEALQTGGKPAGLPANAIQLIPFTNRASVKELAGMDQYLDLIIPRGGKGLIETVVSLARMPVIKHYDGICHVFVDVGADLAMAAGIVIDSKTQKPSVCNALETLLVHEGVAEEFLPGLADRLAARGVELRGCEQTRELLGEVVVPATPEDWDTEYLDYILAIKVVGSVGEAIDHINAHSSQHTESIVTEDTATAERFLREVDSACVLHNVSTRFSDGEEFGFGAEIGISTGKLHARGPMALRELTSYQYRVRGTGQLKAPVED